MGRRDRLDLNSINSQVKSKAFSTVLASGLLLALSSFPDPSFASDGPKGIPALQKGRITSQYQRGLGFGKDYCWELIYGERCTVK